MTIREKLQTLNDGLLELHYFKNAVSYDSLFENDYVVGVYKGNVLKEMVHRVYASKPRWLEVHPVIAQTADGNFWLYAESDDFCGPPIWYWDGGVNKRFKTLL